MKDLNKKSKCVCPQINDVKTKWSCKTPNTLFCSISTIFSPSFQKWKFTLQSGKGQFLYISTFKIVSGDIHKQCSKQERSWNGRNWSEIGRNRSRIGRTWPEIGQKFIEIGQKWVELGQKLVKNWSKGGQKLVKNWSKIDQKSV